VKIDLVVKVDYSIANILVRYLKAKFCRVSQSSISIKIYQSLQYCKLFKIALALAYVLYYLCIAWLQLQRLKWSLIERVLMEGSMLT